MMPRNITITQEVLVQQPHRTSNTYDEPAESDDEPIPSTSYGGRTCSSSSNTTSLIAPLQHGHGLTSAANHGRMMRGDEIANLLMQVADKKEQCWNFDLQRHLQLYCVSRFRDINFPEAAMLISSAVQIYGRKVDYLSDIIMHMNDGQKEREKKSVAEKKAAAAENGADGGTTPETDTDPNGKPAAGRKRAGRFNPQSLSDCFGDLEFTCSDKKLQKMETLIKVVAHVEVDRRTKVQQMQDLCRELRANPSRQRRQEILNRLRDDASIAPIMSSNGAPRKNQILDLESGDTIGTRYDYQIHQNYIDGQTGSLIAEHDLKRFFQRCDVIDFLSDQHESERERCVRLGMPVPADLLAARERELKLYMPREYLQNRYRITVHNTEDFDNAVLQARITNYSSDPILSLMDEAERRNAIATTEPVIVPVPNGQHNSTVCAADTSEKANESKQDLYDSGYGNETTVTDGEDPSFYGVLSSSQVDGNSIKIESMNQSSSVEEQTTSNGTIESELMALENQTTPDKQSLSDVKRLSVDEGIGVDRESPPRCGTSPLCPDVTPGTSVLFTGGTVFPRPSAIRPVKLIRNVLGIPEELARKHVPFALPMEYRKMKGELVRRQAEEMKRSCNVKLFSLKYEESTDILRPSTPDQEDFIGFDDDDLVHDLNLGESERKWMKTIISKTSSSPLKHKRSPSPELFFKGFNEADIAASRKATEAWLNRAPVVQTPKHPESPRLRSTNGGNGGSKSQTGTPTRTLSCDSGISDTIDRSGVAKVLCPQEPPIPEDDGDGGFSDSDELVDCPGRVEGSDESAPGVVDAGNKQPGQEHTDASNARIQQSMQEAKERFDKVSQWHRKLKPILVESEKRNHFDIHAYGSTIIETFDPTAPYGAESITLAKVLDSKPPYSTARFFLSMLMLANTNNVQICNRNDNPLKLSTTEDIELRLLSRKRHHKELEALGELLPGHADADGPGDVRKPQRGRKDRKRKLSLEDEPRAQAETGESEQRRPDPAVRLQGDLGAIDDGPSFFDGVQQMYSELTNGDAQRKRVAFRKGMRNCAYGLAGTADEPSTGRKKPSPAKSPALTHHKRQPEVRFTQPLPPILMPSESEAMGIEEDLMTVDLVTNHVTLVPYSPEAIATAVVGTGSRDPDTSCAKSVFSLAESGYESLLSGGDDI